MARKRRIKGEFDRISSATAKEKLEPELEIQLWRRVIVQAIRDAGSSNAKTRASIFSWMNTPEYKNVCSSARINPVPLKKGLMVLLETATNFPRVVVIKSIEAMEKELDRLSV